MFTFCPLGLCFYRNNTWPSLLTVRDDGNCYPSIISCKDQPLESIPLRRGKGEWLCLLVFHLNLQITWFSQSKRLSLCLYRNCWQNTFSDVRNKQTWHFYREKGFLSVLTCMGGTTWLSLWIHWENPKWLDGNPTACTHTFHAMFSIHVISCAKVMHSVLKCGSRKFGAPWIAPGSWDYLWCWHPELHSWSSPTLLPAAKEELAAKVHLTFLWAPLNSLGVEVNDKVAVE